MQPNHQQQQISETYHSGRGKLADKCFKVFTNRESIYASILNHSQNVKACEPVFRTIHKMGKLQVERSEPFTNGESFPLSVLCFSQTVKASG